MKNFNKENPRRRRARSISFKEDKKFIKNMKITGVSMDNEHGLQYNFTMYKIIVVKCRKC